MQAPKLVLFPILFWLSMVNAIIGVMARILLALVALLNLTLVCQGHDDKGRHTDFHLTIVGEPSLAVRSLISCGDQERASAVVPGSVQASSQRPGFAVQSVTDAHPDAQSFSVLGAVAFVSMLGLAAAARRHIRPIISTMLVNQIDLSPLDPPPR